MQLVPSHIHRLHCLECPIRRARLLNSHRFVVRALQLLNQRQMSSVKTISVEP